jgi:poly(3-hydroxybutyrate) depolymerase
MLNPFHFVDELENSWLYTAIETYKANSAPFRAYIKSAQEWVNSPYHPISYFPISRTSDAFYELIERITQEYHKPAFDIHRTMVNEHAYYVEEEVIIEKTFCRLVHFRKLPQAKDLPKLLIVAPMSGHYATLLRGTVEDCLPYFDVYITDWVNAREVPLNQGGFNLDDFIDYTIEFMQKLSPNLSVMAVCQPAVPVSAAIAIMSAENPQSSEIPINMILIGGPIDTRVSPTQVNLYASDKDIEWFENNVLTRVPINYPGFLREVYPGFLQLAGFMSMNMKRHIGEHMKLFQHLIVGDDDSSDRHIKFYDEYLAVMDIPAEFYLQTIQEVFIEHSLPQGLLVSRGRAVKLEAIVKTALLVLEGELDDITGLEQTKAAINLCTSIPKERKEYHLQIGVGHYGLFNGSKFRSNIVPLIKEFTYRHLNLT